MVRQVVVDPGWVGYIRLYAMLVWHYWQVLVRSVVVVYWQCDALEEYGGVSSAHDV